MEITMIHDIKYIIGNGNDPHYNLALEEYLLNHVKEEECILYLWQNEKTVVIGRNQNAHKECKIRELEEDGGTFVRRLSGGGAVFHDLGNLNFTFIVKKEDYDINKQLEVILKAVNSFSIPAKKSGRNDITVNDKKFSGNAFYESYGNCYHHGTILVHVDKEKLSYYLNVSKDKLVAKGVESVRARVTNLTEYVDSLTTSSMQNSLVEAFSEVYECVARKYQDDIDEDELTKLVDKFTSWEWKYGKRLEGNYTMSKRFLWGGVEFVFYIDGGIIKDLVIYSDTLDTELTKVLETCLKDCIFNSNAMISALGQFESMESDIYNKINDVSTFIAEEGMKYGI
jgi:lipoate-protein ligase A